MLSVMHFGNKTLGSYHREFADWVYIWTQSLQSFRMKDCSVGTPCVHLYSNGDSLVELT